MPQDSDDQKETKDGNSSCYAHVLGTLTNNPTPQPEEVIENHAIHGNNVHVMDTDLLKQRLIGKIAKLPEARLAELARVAFRDEPSVLADLPDKKAAKLPTDRPKWRDRKGAGRDPKDAKLKPPYYIQKHYGDHLDGTVSRSALRHPDVDPPLYQALKNWLKNNDMPDDVNLPTASERVESELQQLDENAVIALNGRDYNRLRSATRYRQLTA